MSKERQARDLALREYDKFMDKYKEGVESGDMRQFIKGTKQMYLYEIVRPTHAFLLKARFRVFFS